MPTTTKTPELTTSVPHTRKVRVWNVDSKKLVDKLDNVTYEIEPNDSVVMGRSDAIKFKGLYPGTDAEGRIKVKKIRFSPIEESGTSMKTRLTAEEQAIINARNAQSGSQVKRDESMVDALDKVTGVLESLSARIANLEGK